MSEVKLIITAQDQASRVLNKLTGAVKGLGTTSKSSFASMGSIIGGTLIAGGIAKVTNAAVDMGQAMIGAVAGATAAAADLNAQISAIGAVSGASAGELASIKDLIFGLGIDPKLKVSATEAADAIEMLARNGLKLPDIMNGAARATVLLANSTGSDFATAANISTDAMAIFGITAQDMATAVNGITSVTTNSKFDINDYALALAQAGGVAATVGVGFEDFNTTIAAISPLFASGSDAGTSFKTFLQRLVPQTKGATKSMMELGLMTADGQNAFFDANGQMKDMAEISGLLNRSLGNLTEEQKNQTLATLFGTDAMRAAAGLMGYTEEQFKALQTTMGKTDAEQAAALRLNNLSGDMEIFSGVVETLTLQVGDKFQPAMRKLFQGLAPIAESLTPKLVAIADIFGKGLELIIPNLGALNEAFIVPALDTFIANLQVAKANAKIALEVTGDIPTALIAGLAGLTGGTVTIDAVAGIVDVEWGQWSYIYDAAADIYGVDFVSKLTGGKDTYTYDALAGILDVDWESGIEGGFVYSAEAGVQHVEWKAGDPGEFEFVYDAVAGITDVQWDNLGFSYTYNALAEIGDGDVLWGGWTWVYDAQAGIDETSVLWGVWTYVYDASADISETSVLWGVWTYVYDASADISETSVLWGAWSYVYNAVAAIGLGDVRWGDWSYVYNAVAHITGITSKDIADVAIDVIANIKSWTGIDLINLVISAPDWLPRLSVPSPSWLPMLVIPTPVFSWPTVPEAFTGWSWPRPTALLSWMFPSPSGLYAWTFPSPASLLKWAFPSPTDLLSWSWPRPTALLSWMFPSPSALYAWSFPSPAALLKWAFPLPTDLLSWSWPSIPRPAWLQSLINALGGGGGSSATPADGSTHESGAGSGGPGHFGGAIGQLSWPGGLGWVGETGPELVALPARSRIYSPSESMQLAGGGNITVNISATVADSLDIESLAYRIADVIRRRR